MDDSREDAKGEEWMQRVEELLAIVVSLNCKTKETGRDRGGNPATNDRRTSTYQYDDEGNLTRQTTKSDNSYRMMKKLSRASEAVVADQKLATARESRPTFW